MDQIIRMARRRVRDLAQIEDHRWAKDFLEVERRLDAGDRLTLNEMFPDLTATELVIVHFRCLIGLTQVQTACQMAIGERQIRRVERTLERKGISI